MALKAVTNGHTLEETYADYFANKNRTLTPYSPVHIKGTRNNANADVRLEWVRRDRIANGWNNYADVGLSEASEWYKVHVYASVSAVTSVVATVVVSGAVSTVLSSANQVTWFGSTQPTMKVGIFQISAQVGNGIEGQKVI
jgi:hypothetical protein